MSQIIVADLGKHADEHFEFNRGIYLSLRKDFKDITFVGFESMVECHREVFEGCKIIQFGELRCDILRRKVVKFLTKIYSTFCVFKLILSTTSPIIFLYLHPLSHLLISGWSLFSRRKFIVFLHGEIEFLNRKRISEWRIGEILMMLALFVSSRQLSFVTLTKYASSCLARRFKKPNSFFFCPHPIFREILGTLDEKHNSVQKDYFALSFARSSGSLTSLMEVLSTRIFNGKLINLNGVHMFSPPVEAHELLKCGAPGRSDYLDRDQFLKLFETSKFYILSASEGGYNFSASGLACVSAAARTPVFGLNNWFMREYQLLYPEHFVVVDSELSESPELNVGIIDNSDEISAVLRNLV